MASRNDDDDAFGAELVEQDDGHSNSTSQQVTPRVRNLAPQSFSSFQNTHLQLQNTQVRFESGCGQSFTSTNNNNNNNLPSGPSPSTSTGTTPTQANININNNNNNNNDNRKSPRTRGEGHFASVVLAADESMGASQNNNSNNNSNSNNNNVAGVASFGGTTSATTSGLRVQHSNLLASSSSASMFGNQTTSTSSIQLLASSIHPAAVAASANSGVGAPGGSSSSSSAYGSSGAVVGGGGSGAVREVPGQHPNMYLSFSMIPGRKSVMSTTSNVSNYFTKSQRGGGGGDDDDSDSRRGTPSSQSHGSDKDLNKKKLPQPVASMSEIEEELQSELLRCVTEQTPSCNLSRLQIQRIPQELRCFSWLRELLLGDNNIALLPDTIFLQMQQLEVLDLMENKLVTIPRSIFQLRSLKRVLLDHNKIACLPDDIDPDPVEQFGLPELLEVGLEWNALQQFPINFLIYAPKLERMFLSENPGISALPRPQLLEGRTKKIHIRLDNRPMLLQAAASNPVYAPAAGVVALEWNKIYPDRVLDFLYLGSMRTAQCVEVYQDLDIGYVLTAARNLDVVLGPGMKHLTLPFDDLPGEDISHFFETCFKFVDEACANKKGILIHCFAGLSRSVAMTMGYLMKKFGIGADDALDLIKQSRPSAHPNEGFVTRLREYSRELGIKPEDSKRVKAELEKKNHKNIATTTATMTSSKAEAGYDD